VLITHLKLQNFKSYVEAHIDFQPGTNAIIGANGAGKSTLLEAIGFVLFDHRESGMNLAGLLREGSTAGMAMVRLTSSYDERDYEVERKFTNKTTTSYRIYDVELGWQVLAEGQDDVLAWLREHLCADPLASLDVLFENTVGVPQGTFTAPFLQPAGARKAIFDPLLQVDAYQKSIDSLRHTIRHLETQGGAIQQEIVRLSERLTDLPRLQGEGDLLFEDLTAIARQAETTGHELARLEQEQATMDEAERLVRDLAARLEQARTEQNAHQRLLANARRELAEAEAAQAEATLARPRYEAYLEVDARLKDLDGQRSRRDRLGQEQNRLQQEDARLATRMDQLTHDLEAMAQAANSLQALAPLVEQQAVLEAEVRAAEEAVREAEEAERRASATSEELARAQAEVEHLRGALVEAAELDRSLAQAEERLSILTERDREAQQRQAAVHAEMQRLRQQAATLAEASTARCPVCEAELTPRHRTELLERNTRLLQKQEAEDQALQTRIAGLVRESQALNYEIQRSRQRLRQLPTAENLRLAEDAVQYRHAVHQQASESLGTFRGATERLQTRQRLLTRLGDPRREAQRHEDQLLRRPATEQELAQQQSRCAELQQSIARLDDALAPFARLDEALREAHALRDLHQSAHDSFLAHSRIAQEWAPRSERVQQLTQEGEALAGQMANLSLQHHQAMAGYNKERHALVRQQVAAFRGRLAGLDAQRQAKQDRLSTVRQEVLQLEEMQGDLLRQQAALQETNALRALVENIRETLRQAGPLVTQQRVRQVSREASNLYGDIMGQHAARLQWSEDYELSLEVKGLKRTFRQLSGGEQMSAALALRLALLRQISQIDVAFLDEPTAHLDPERRESLAEKITQVQGFSQLFVISHDDTFERAAQSYIRIVKDENGSRVEGT
jgi:exonuclease SbcC